MTDTACFAIEGDGYRPLDLARSYWGQEAIGGRAVVGIIGAAIEQRHAADGLMPARLTVDMFSLAPFEPFEIRTRVIKDGRRLRLVAAEWIARGEVFATATCQLLAPSSEPPGRAWNPGPWTVPHPDTLAEDRVRPRGFDLRWAVGHLGATTEKRCWIRERVPLVEGQPLTPFARVAVAADYASPFTNAGDAGIRFMNTDVTLHLHRLPEGEWIGFEATGYEASQGIAVGHSRLHDVSGAIGYASCTALANRKREAK